MRCLQLFYQDESATSALEYALLGALILGVIVAAVSTLGTTVSQLYDYVRDQFSSILS